MSSVFPAVSFLKTFLRWSGMGKNKKKARAEEGSKEEEVEAKVQEADPDNKAQQEDERELRARMAEARMQALQSKGKGGGQPAGGRLSLAEQGRRAGYVAKQSAPAPKGNMNQDLAEIRKLRAAAYAAQSGEKGTDPAPVAQDQPPQTEKVCSEPSDTKEETKVEASPRTTEEEAPPDGDEEMPASNPEAEAPPREMTDAAKAALARAEAAQQNISKEKREEMAIKREKNDLLGSIQTIAAAKGVTLPFGLPSLSLPALRQYKNELTKGPQVHT